MSLKPNGSSASSASPDFTSDRRRLTPDRPYANQKWVAFVYFLVVCTLLAYCGLSCLSSVGSQVRCLYLLVHNGKFLRKQ
ncbi:unnamed protein product [Callosobruchus maculatus]|uniref:Uncharacterized protein n=1 Tax=Callosobruchus maculatus TaxID=64391 RepID=A0A653BTQ3_CALMS|nr:unnamed protein product [Callosobruchus maculatus]